MNKDKNIQITLTPLEASNLNGWLRLFSDTIEAIALKQNRLMTGEEDLGCSTLAWLHSQIAQQAHKMNETEIAQAMGDYNRDLRLEREHQAENN